MKNEYIGNKKAADMSPNVPAALNLIDNCQGDKSHE